MKTIEEREEERAIFEQKMHKDRIVSIQVDQALKLVKLLPRHSNMNDAVSQFERCMESVRKQYA